ncbi:MAG: hypothetical protein CMH21_02495 [Methylophaga sp.]|nr:hypothetical protein [Methylophaga sp.]MAY16597.1 hypothetical protein [Methylophaga sp.]MBN44901.1 hypothetical protein [Methylophaga sp.]
MIVLRFLRRNCLEPWQHGAAQAVRGHRRLRRKRAPHAQPLTARTPWYIQRNSKTAYPNPNEGTNRQAQRAGPQGPEKSGIKAGWP